MKKLPFILLFALVLVYLCACGAAGPAARAAISASRADIPVCISATADTAPDYVVFSYRSEIVN